MMVELDARETEIILRMAECSLNVSEAAEKMYMCRTTLVYNIEKLMKKTGLDARKFYDLVKLLDLLEKKEEA